jgi:signal transduction histidine kinase
VTGPGGPRLRALIADDGQGFDLNQSGGHAHFGLVIMRERAEGVGGALHITSTPGQGTQVLVDMPIESGAPVIAPGAPTLGGER